MEQESGSFQSVFTPRVHCCRRAFSRERSRGVISRTSDELLLCILGKSTPSLDSTGLRGARLQHSGWLRGIPGGDGRRPRRILVGMQSAACFLPVVTNPERSLHQLSGSRADVDFLVSSNIFGCEISFQVSDLHFSESSFHGDALQLSMVWHWEGLGSCPELKE